MPDIFAEIFGKWLSDKITVKKKKKYKPTLTKKINFKVPHSNIAELEKEASSEVSKTK